MEVMGLMLGEFVDATTVCTTFLGCTRDRRADFYVLDFCKFTSFTRGIDLAGSSQQDV
jgi:hypothetical protein